MKTITIHLFRVATLLTLYICCTSVVCCDAGKATIITREKENKEKLYQLSSKDDITPTGLLSLRLTELLY